MMIATESITVKKKLKITFAGKRIDVDPKAQQCDSECDLSVTRNGKFDTGNVNGQTEMGKMLNYVMPSCGKPASNCSTHRVSMEVTNKRCPPEILEGPRKKLCMDRSVTQQCSAIWKKLSRHKYFFPFKVPVDPVALNIPDYFSIISEPMDLGTVKSKLAKNIYHGPEEFAADVRLTFSNAMLYNPPGNDVHKMAAVLSKVFESEWEVLEVKWNSGTTKSERGRMDKFIKELNDREQSGPITSGSGLPESGLPEKVKCDNDAIITRVKVSKSVQTHVAKPPEDATKGTSTSRSSHASHSKSARHASHSKCGTCCGITCQCNHQNDSMCASSDLPSTQSPAKIHKDHVDTSKVERSRSTVQTSKSLDSDGAVSIVDDGNVYSSPELATPATDAVCGEGWSASLPDVQLSPQKALRAAILKTRFADTILKAQQKTLLDLGDKTDPSKLQQEKERLERRQREEKARIEAQIRAAETAARMRAEAESKIQREKDREAARTALQEMQKTVDIWESIEILKELEKLSRDSLTIELPDSCGGSTVTSGSFDLSPGRKVLESLGLFLEDDYMEEDGDEEEVQKGGEEGEICP